MCAAAARCVTYSRRLGSRRDRDPRCLFAFIESFLHPCPSCRPRSATMRNPTALLPRSRARFFSPPNDKLELTRTIGLCIVSLSLRSIFLPFSLPFSPNFLFPRYLLDRSDPIKSIHSVSSFPPQIPLVGYSSDVQRVFGLVPFAFSLMFFFFTFFCNHEIFSPTRQTS